MSLMSDVPMESDEKEELPTTSSPLGVSTHLTDAHPGTVVEAETNSCEYKSLCLRKGRSNNDLCVKTLHTYFSKKESWKDLNAMLNTSGGGEIHFGIDKTFVVEEGLTFSSDDRERITKAVSDIIAAFYPAPEQDLHQIEWISLDSGRQRFVIRLQHRPLTDTLRYHLLRRDQTQAFHRRGIACLQIPADQLFRSPTVEEMSYAQVLAANLDAIRIARIRELVGWMSYNDDTLWMRRHQRMEEDHLAFLHNSRAHFSDKLHELYSLLHSSSSVQVINHEVVIYQRVAALVYKIFYSVDVLEIIVRRMAAILVILPSAPPLACPPLVELDAVSASRTIPERDEKSSPRPAESLEFGDVRATIIATLAKLAHDGFQCRLSDRTFAVRSFCLLASTPDAVETFQHIRSRLLTANTLSDSQHEEFVDLCKAASALSAANGEQVERRTRRMKKKAQNLIDTVQMRSQSCCVLC